MPALKPIPAAGSRQVEKRGKTNKPWNSTLNAPRSAPHAPVPGLRPGLGDGSPLAGPWIGFRRDSRAAVSAGGRPCNGNPRTKTGTNHRTLAPRPLAHPRRPIASPDGLGGVGGLSIWLWPLFGSSLADHPEIPTSSCDSLHSLAGPLAWSAEAANLVPSLSHGLSMPALARSPRRTPRSSSWRRPGAVWPGRANTNARPVGTTVRLPTQCTVTHHSQLRESTDFGVAWLGVAMQAGLDAAADWAYESTLSILLCARCLDTHGITSTSGRRDALLALGPQTSQSAHLTTCAAHQVACDPHRFTQTRAADPPAPMQTITQAEREWLLICRKQTAHESPLRPEVWQPINALSLTSRAGSGSDSTTSRDRFRTPDPS